MFSVYSTQHEIKNSYYNYVYVVTMYMYNMYGKNAMNKLYY